MRLNKTLLNVRVYSPTIGEQAIALLRRKSATVLAFGTAAHDGLTPQNFLLSDGSTGLTAVDGLVGKAKDAIGAIGAIQATAGSRPTLRRGVVNLLTYSQDFTNAAWSSNPVAVIVATTIIEDTTLAPDGTITADSITVAGGTSRMYNGTSVGLVTGKAFTFAVWLWSTTGKTTIAMRMYDNPTGTNAVLRTINLTSTPTLYTLSRSGFTSSDTTLVCGFENRVAQGGDGIAGTFVAWGGGLLAGTLTAAQILAAGGIPLTTTAPASSTQGPYWLDTAAGTKTLGSTFPAGNESDIVIDAAKTGATVATAQNLTGAYTINTDTCGRIIIPGTIAAPAVLTAGETALLTAYANRLAGL